MTKLLARFLDYTVDIYEDCGEGIQLYESLNFTEPLVALESERNINVFADLRQDYGYLGDLTVSTLNPASTLTIDLNPNTVLTSYPGLSGTGFDPQDLIFDNQGSMATAVTTVINHAIGLWNSGALYEVDAYIPAGTDGLVIRFFVYNDPTQVYVCLSDNSQLQYYQYGDPRNVQYATPTGSASTYRPEDVNGTFVSACGGKGDFTFEIHDITIYSDPQYWHSTSGTLRSFNILTSGKVECSGEIACDNPTILCDNGSCTPCTGGTLTELVCSPEALATLSTELTHFDVQAGQSTLSSLTVPTMLYHLQFCDGSMRYVFKEEIGLFSVDYITRQRIPVFGFAEQFKLEYADETAEIGGLTELLSARPGNNDLRVSALPDTTEAGSGGDGGNNGNSGNGGDEDAQGIQVSYFIYDHLGNTRVLYHTVLDCDEDEVNYVLEHVVDYYPYGKVLREWQQCDQARYMTTYHERDLESGYDYRGARFYDADLGRFLSVDPMATEFPGWSSYNYVLANPIIFVDPTGMAPKGWSKDNVELANRFGVFGDNNENFDEYRNLFPSKDRAIKFGLAPESFVFYNDGSNSMTASVRGIKISYAETVGGRTTRYNERKLDFEVTVPIFLTELWGGRQITSVYAADKAARSINEAFMIIRYRLKSDRAYGDRVFAPGGLDILKRDLARETQVLMTLADIINDVDYPSIPGTRVRPSISGRVPSHEAVYITLGYILMEWIRKD